MAEVLFITPSLRGVISDNFLGTILLTTILKNNGVKADILGFHDFGNLDDFDSFIENALKAVVAKSPKIVSFYTRCDTYHITLKLAKLIKERIDGVYIVFGGPQSDLSALDTMRYMPFVDYICCGEGETTVYPFFSSLLKDEPDTSVPGLVFRSGDSIITNPRPKLLEDLDTLPTLDYSLFVINEELDENNEERFPVDVGRGCPFACTFCSTKTFWGRKYRLKSAERIVQEIKEAHDNFGVTEFSFKHDMFTSDREKVIEICKMIKELDFPMKWTCSARVDCIDRELIDIMHDAGMYMIYIGIETGSPRMQKIINKNLSLDGVPELFGYIGSKGIEAKASLIFGFPEETEEDFSETISFLSKLVDYPNVVIKVNMCTFFPGTELTEKYYGSLTRASVITNQTYDRAVSACNDIIDAYPVLFPQYREYKTPLRDKMEKFPYFFKSWKAMSPIYHYIAAKYEENRLCDMYFAFAESIKNVEFTEHDLRPIFVDETFIDNYKDDEKYGLIKEVFRFIKWRIYGFEGGADLFGFDVETFVKTNSLEGLSEKLTFVCVTKNELGSFDFTFRS